MNTLKHTLAKLEIFQRNQQTVNMFSSDQLCKCLLYKTATKVKTPLRNLQQKPHFHYKLVKVPLYLNKKACIGERDRFGFINNIM